MSHKYINLDEYSGHQLKNLEQRSILFYFFPDIRFWGFRLPFILYFLNPVSLLQFY